MKKVAHNKVLVSKELKRKIRLLFFRQIEMEKIKKAVKLTESVIRRIINENNWVGARERYIRFLASYSFLHNISLTKMAEITRVNRYSLGRIHRKYGTNKPKRFAWNKRITIDTENKFIQEYVSGNSSAKIAKKYGFKRDKTVLDVLKKRGILRRPQWKQTCYKEDFFEKIDSSEKAYTLGLIMTDGYIIKDYEGFGIQLTKEDGYILEKIRDIVGGTNPITQIDCSIKRKTFPNTKDMCRLHVFNKKMAKDLKKLGVVKRKTKILRYNGCIYKKYLSHFFRGLVDGDGSIGLDKRNYPWLYVFSSSSYGFVLDVKRIINFKTSIRNHGKNHWVLGIGGGRKGIFSFAKFIYKNKGDFYLRRKYAKVQDYIG